VPLEPTFKRDEKNPLPEFAELRMEVLSDEGEFDVNCQLRFSSDEIDVVGRTFRVGIEEARLQLALEGCETVLGKDFGEALLAPVAHSETLTRETSTAASLGGSLDALGTPSGEIGASTSAAKNHVTQINQTRQSLPMTALPNAGWRIKSIQVVDGAGNPLDGTAMRGERLTRLKRRSGGNRVSVVAELQVKRSSITVKPTKGNRWGRMFSAASNKDAIVALILQRAMRREAASVPQQHENTVVVSRAAVTEE
jgi:hypothetical protein